MNTLFPLSTNAPREQKTFLRLFPEALAMAASVLVLTIGAASGCSDDDSSSVPDAAVDAAINVDAVADAGEEVDGGSDAATQNDGDTPDAGQQDPPLPGWGDISGACDVLDQEEWGSSDPFLFTNSIDFGTTGFDETALTPGGTEIWEDGNLGGSSIHSEIIAYELLHRCELAALLKTEGEIVYQDDGGKKTDILVELDSYKVGVSVTRAFHWPPEDPYTVPEAEALIADKLSDIPLSAANADPQDAWSRSILHVVAYDPQYASTVETAFNNLDASIKGDTIVIVTVTNGDDEFAY